MQTITQNMLAKLPEIDSLCEKIEKRRHIEKMLHNINAELKIAQKVRESE